MMNQDQAKSLRDLVSKSKEEDALHSKESTDIITEALEPKIYAFVGIIEGVGNTTIASNLAKLLSEEGKKAVVIDFNSDFLTTDIYFNIIPNYSLDRLVDKSKAERDMLTKARDNIYTIYASKILSASTQQKLAFRDRISNVISGADCVIIDIYGVQNLEIVDFLLEKAKVILTAVPTAEGIQSAYYGIKHLSKNMNIDEIGVIINKSTGRDVSNRVFEKLNSTVIEFLKVEIKNLGYISMRNEIKESVKNQKLFIEEHPYSTSVEELRGVNKVLSN